MLRGRVLRAAQVVKQVQFRQSFCVSTNASNLHYTSAVCPRAFHVNRTVSQQEVGEDEGEVVFKQFITPEFYFKNKQELSSIFVHAMGPLITSITQAESHPYTPKDIPGFILGTHELRAKVFKAATEKFGREIPSRDIPKIITVQNLVDWFVEKVQSEKPKPAYFVPDNVKLFIEQNAQIRQRELNKRAAFSVREKQEASRLRRHKQLYGDTDLTQEQVELIKQKLRSGETQQ